jgi:hypothetical protein
MPGCVEAVQLLGKENNALWAKMIDTDLLQDGNGAMGLRASPLLFGKKAAIQSQL